MDMDLHQSPHLAAPLVTLFRVFLALLWVLQVLILGSDLLTVVLLRRRARRDQTVRPSLPLWPYRLQRLFARAAAVLLLTGVSAALLASLTDKLRRTSLWRNFSRTSLCSPWRRWRGTAVGRLGRIGPPANT